MSTSALFNAFLIIFVTDATLPTKFARTDPSREVDSELLAHSELALGPSSTIDLVYPLRTKSSCVVTKGAVESMSSPDSAADIRLSHVLVESTESYFREIGTDFTTHAQFEITEKLKGSADGVNAKKWISFVNTDEMVAILRIDAGYGWYRYNDVSFSDPVKKMLTDGKFDEVTNLCGTHYVGTFEKRAHVSLVIRVSNVKRTERAEMRKSLEASFEALSIGASGNGKTLRTALDQVEQKGARVTTEVVITGGEGMSALSESIKAFSGGKSPDEGLVQSLFGGVSEYVKTIRPEKVRYSRFRMLPLSNLDPRLATPVFTYDIKLISRKLYQLEAFARAALFKADEAITHPRHALLDPDSSRKVKEYYDFCKRNAEMTLSKISENARACLTQAGASDEQFCRTLANGIDSWQESLSSSCNWDALSDLTSGRLVTPPPVLPPPPTSSSPSKSESRTTALTTAAFPAFVIPTAMAAAATSALLEGRPQDVPKAVGKAVENSVKDVGRGAKKACRKLGICD